MIASLTRIFRAQLELPQSGTDHPARNTDLRAAGKVGSRDKCGLQPLPCRLCLPQISELLAEVPQKSTTILWFLDHLVKLVLASIRGRTPRRPARVALRLPLPAERLWDDNESYLGRNVDATLGVLRARLT